MDVQKFFSVPFLCGLLVLLIVVCGCTSSDPSDESPDTGSVASPDTGGMSGTYTSVEDPANRFVLNPDGTVQWKNDAGGFTGTYTVVNGELKVCAEEKDGTSCIYTSVDGDGSFVYGLNTYRK
jgi:hypothetical protein